MEQRNTIAEVNCSIVPAPNSEEIGRAVRAMKDHPIIRAILTGMGGAIAVLDADCRVVAVNQAYLEAVGVLGTEDVLGVRPGVAFHCLHTKGKECGTASACANCGVVSSVAAAQRDLITTEGDWSISADLGNGRVDLDFQVRAVPMQLEGTSFTLVALTNKTQERRREALERAFFNDMSRAITGMVATSCYFDDGDWLQCPDVARKMQTSVRRLSRELEIQRALISGETETCTVCVEEVAISDIYGEIQLIVGHQSPRLVPLSLL